MTHNLCPYTLKPLTELHDTSKEHIFPDAIGGGTDYCVLVSTKENSCLGTRIDAPLINSFLISGLCVRYNIRSRRRRNRKWKLRGKLEDSGREVEVEFSKQGEPTIYIRKPVDMDSSGTSGTLILKADKSKEFLDQFIQNHKEKKRTVVVSSTETKAEAIEVPITVDVLALERMLAKIAFLAVYKCLGDDYLDDPLVKEWHKAFLLPNENDARNARIYGNAFDCQNVLDFMFPTLQPYEHAVAVANLRQEGPVVAVALFGSSFSYAGRNSV